jgi:hypothetical protein
MNKKKFKEYLLKKKETLGARIYSYANNSGYKSQMRLLNEIIKKYDEIEND